LRAASPVDAAAARTADGAGDSTMAELPGPDAETAEFSDDASYAWWRNSHPHGYVLAVRARQPPLLHHAKCRDVDRDLRPGRLTGRGSRQICADTKSALRAWVKRELPNAAPFIARCPKCEP
jgi:hypothetical protein